MIIITEYNKATENDAPKLSQPKIHLTTNDFVCSNGDNQHEESENLTPDNSKVQQDSCIKENIKGDRSVGYR